MYTDPQYRRRGINQKIIDELTKWARSKNITELRLEVYFGNSQAIKAYEKAGFIKHMLTMRSEVFP
jgi:ribosomal protein S18 acetylase RimI-like enzyme